MKNKTPYVVKLKKMLANLVESQIGIKKKLKTEKDQDIRSEYDRLRHRTGATIAHLHYLLDPIKCSEPPHNTVRYYSNNNIYIALEKVYDDLVDEVAFHALMKKDNVKHFIAKLPILVKDVPSNEMVEVHLSEGEKARTFGCDTVQKKLVSEYKKEQLFLTFKHLAETKDDGKRMGVYIVTKQFIPNVKVKETDHSKVATWH